VPRRRSLVTSCLAAASISAMVLALGALTAGAAQAPDEEVRIESVSPAGGPPGTEIVYTLGGTDEAGTRECATSSAYRLELLSPDGSLSATGGENVAVPDTATPGDSSIRLVCYVPDATNRRVIHGVCAGFVVTAAGEPAPPESGPAAIDCPPTPRVTLGQSVIAIERAMSEAFNPLLFYPLPK
jgi:hypothetical protein